LLICSLGNPGSTYFNTRHSVGHLVLEYVRNSLQLDPFVAAPRLLGSITADTSCRITLFQSATYMNLSGDSVSLAWRDFRKDLTAADSARARLVVVHDDLENHLGMVKVKLLGKGNGHRGIQSCNCRLGTEDYTRLAIGIGRPVSRDSDIVSDYVLGKFKPKEIAELEDTVISRVLAAIENLRIPQPTKGTKSPKVKPKLPKPPKLPGELPESFPKKLKVNETTSHDSTLVPTQTEFSNQTEPAVHLARDSPSQICVSSAAG